MKPQRCSMALDPDTVSETIRSGRDNLRQSASPTVGEVVRAARNTACGIFTSFTLPSATAAAERGESSITPISPNISPMRSTSTIKALPFRSMAPKRTCPSPPMIE
jgi:hypothetical protein